MIAGEIFEPTDTQKKVIKSLIKDCDMAQAAFQLAVEGHHKTINSLWRSIEQMFPESVKFKIEIDQETGNLLIQNRK